jgi:hypothetical protein
MFSISQLLAGAYQSAPAPAPPLIMPTSGVASPGGRPAIFLVGGPSGVGKDSLLLGAKQQLLTGRL